MAAKKLLSGKYGKWLLLGGVALGAYYLFGRSAKGGEGKAGPGPSKPGTPPSQPVAVRPGESLSARTYQLLGSRRAGYRYAPAKADPTGLLTFKAPAGVSTFTRYVVREGNKLVAEFR